MAQKGSLSTCFQIQLTSRVTYNRFTSCLFCPRETKWIVFILLIFWLAYGYSAIIIQGYHHNYFIGCSLAGIWYPLLQAYTLAGKENVYLSHKSIEDIIILGLVSSLKLIMLSVKKSHTFFRRWIGRPNQIVIHLSNRVIFQHQKMFQCFMGTTFAYQTKKVCFNGIS